MSERLFSRDQAEALLERLRPLLERGRELAGEALEDTDVQSSNGGGDSAHRAAAARRQLRDLVAEIVAMGIVYRDPRRGLVDFPAELEGRPVFLCWRLGEASVGWWHDRDSGFAGRRRLE